jgi:hypothetical protein
MSDMRTDFMVTFRLADADGICLMRTSTMMCLFPNECSIRTTEGGWAVKVHKDDWNKVEKAFRRAYLERKLAETNDWSTR